MISMQLNKNNKQREKAKKGIKIRMYKQIY